MKGTPEVIAILNELLVAYHTSFVTFGLHNALSKKWGYKEASEKFEHYYEESVECCEHILDRICFLDGMATFESVDDSIEYGETIEEMLIISKNLKMSNIAILTNAIEISTSFKDYGSRHMVEKLLVKEDKNLADIEAQIIQFSERGSA